MTQTHFPDGCLPQNSFDLQTVELLEASAVSFSTLYDDGTMPVLHWDSAFEAFLHRQGNILEDMFLDNKPLFPWTVWNEHVRKGNLYFSQGSTPSCMGHADDFAYRSSLLTHIGLGAPLQWNETDPYQTWLRSKKGNPRGGQSVAAMAAFANKKGHVLKDSRSKSSRSAKNASDTHQSAIIFLSGKGEELADKIRRCNRAGLGVALGNAAAVNGTVIDKNDVQIATLGGRWAHATSFNAWMKKNGQEYVFWTNSHGKRYTKSTQGNRRETAVTQGNRRETAVTQGNRRETAVTQGEPADGAWMRVDKELTDFLETAAQFGMPYACLAEGYKTY